jgi:hypothetical protein
MAIIKVHLLKPGMVLVEEVKNHAGQKLLPEGTQLTEKHILNLKAWGITEANIQGEREDLESTLELENINPQKLEKLAKAERGSKFLFRHSNPDHPAVAELMRLFRLNQLRKTPGMGDIHVK